MYKRQLHYNVPAADKAAQPYQDSFARLVKAHFGAGLRPEIGKVVLGVTNLPATMDAYLQAAEAIESELARSLKVPILALSSHNDAPSSLADLSKKVDELVAVVFSIKNTTKMNEITFSTDVYFFESKERKLAFI